MPQSDSPQLHSCLESCPLVAILRGIKPEEVQAIASVLFDVGLRIVEIPLNSPSPLKSIEILARQLGEDVIVGAGTVLDWRQVPDIRAAGGQLVVMPHGNLEVIQEAKRNHMTCVPGVATPTEAFAALSAGADALKMFPAESLPPAVVKAWRAVLPEATRLIPVGGISAPSLAPYLRAGATGFGLGSALYKPGDSAMHVRRNAEQFHAALAEYASTRS